MPDRPSGAQELASIVDPLARQGIEAAQRHGLPGLADACRRALDALEADSIEDLVGALVALGYRSRDREVTRLWWAACRATARANRLTGRKRDIDPEVAAEVVGNLERQGDWTGQRDALIKRAGELTGVSAATIRRSLARYEAEKGPWSVVEIEIDEHGRLVVTARDRSE